MGGTNGLKGYYRVGEEEANETKKTAALAPAATSTRKKTSPTSLPSTLSFSSSLVLPTRAACLSWGARQKRLFYLSCLFLDAPFLLSNPGGVLKGYGYLSICLFVFSIIFFSVSLTKGPSISSFYLIFTFFLFCSAFLLSSIVLQCLQIVPYAARLVCSASCSVYCLAKGYGNGKGRGSTMVKRGLKGPQKRGDRTGQGRPEIASTGSSSIGR